MKTLLRVLTLTTLLALPFAAPAQNKGGPPVQGGAPFAGAARMTTEEALKQAPKINKDLVKLEKAMNDAQAKMKKKPKDAALKKAYVEATYKYANTAMTDPNLPPAVKYRAALALYRRALKVDPKHKQSLAEKKQIEDIYESMGRPIPQ